MATDSLVRKFSREDYIKWVEDIEAQADVLGVRDFYIDLRDNNIVPAEPAVGAAQGPRDKYKRWCDLKQRVVQSLKETEAESFLRDHAFNIPGANVRQIWESLEAGNLQQLPRELQETTCSAISEMKWIKQSDTTAKSIRGWLGLLRDKIRSAPSVYVPYGGPAVNAEVPHIIKVINKYKLLPPSFNQTLTAMVEQGPENITYEVLCGRLQNRLVTLINEGTVKQDASGWSFLTSSAPGEDKAYFSAVFSTALSGGGPAPVSAGSAAQTRRGKQQKTATRVRKTQPFKPECLRLGKARPEKGKAVSANSTTRKRTTAGAVGVKVIKARDVLMK